MSRVFPSCAQTHVSPSFTLHSTFIELRPLFFLSAWLHFRCWSQNPERYSPSWEIQAAGYRFNGTFTVPRTRRSQQSLCKQGDKRLLHPQQVQHYFQVRMQWILTQPLRWMLLKLKIKSPYFTSVTRKSSDWQTWGQRCPHFTPSFPLPSSPSVHSLTLLKATRKGKKSIEGFEVTLGNRTRDLSHRTPHTHTNQLHQQLYNNFYFISKSLLQNKLKHNP